jgi:hypothetical protein
MDHIPLLKGASMSKRIPKIVALAGVTAALAVGGAGVAQASPDHHGHKNDSCKKLHGKKKRECERKHHR